jgi:hypothetical protein
MWTLTWEKRLMPVLSRSADFRPSGKPEWFVGHCMSLEPCHFPNILPDSFLIVTLGIVLSFRLSVRSSRSLKTSRRNVASNEASRVKGCASTKFYIVYVLRSLCFIISPPASSALDDCFAPSCGTLHDPLRVRDILPPYLGQAKLLCIRLL